MGPSRFHCAHRCLQSAFNLPGRGTTTVFKNGVCCMYSGGMEIARVQCVGKVYKFYGGKETSNARKDRR
jgi:hypothetical protein